VVFRAGTHLWVPYLTIRLGAGRHRTPSFPALVDSGSPYCLFAASVGEFVGLDIESGSREEVFGMSAGIHEPAFFHRVSLFVEGEGIVETTVGFVKRLSVAGILGRIGFFDHFRVCLDHANLPPVLEITRLHKPQ